MNTHQIISKVLLVTLALCVVLGSFGCARTATRVTAAQQFMLTHPCPPGFIDARTSRPGQDGSQRVAVRGCRQRQTYLCRPTANGTIACQPEGGAPMTFATALPPLPPLRRR